MTRAPDRNARVDICIPVYNAAHFVADTIESALVQDFEDCRLLISVDASDDDSARVCRKFAADPRVHVFEQTRRLGWVENCNFLMRSARARFMKFAPHDDLLAPDLIRRLHEFMIREPDCSVAIPTVLGFGQQPLDFHQHEVRGPVLRRMLDVIMNQRCVAAFHGLVRIDGSPERRPALPAEYPKDFEADVYWMAMAAAQGELRRVDPAIVHKRFSPSMTSRSWRPTTRQEARGLLVQHTARLTELAFSVCPGDDERRQILMAAVVRLFGEGLHRGVGNSGRRRPFFRTRVLRRFVRSLTGSAAEFAKRTNRRALIRQIETDPGVVGASRLARRLDAATARGDLTLAESLFRTAAEMDPLAGWADPIRRRLGMRSRPTDERLTLLRKDA